MSGQRRQGCTTRDCPGNRQSWFLALNRWEGNASERTLSSVDAAGRQNEAALVNIAALRRGAGNEPSAGRSIPPVWWGSAAPSRAGNPQSNFGAIDCKSSCSWNQSPRSGSDNKIVITSPASCHKSHPQKTLWLRLAKGFFRPRKEKTVT